MMIAYILFLTFVSSFTIDPVYTIRCADNCTFDTVPIGSLNPFRIPCNTVEIDTNRTMNVCTVDLTINFGTLFVQGVLQIEPRSVRKLPTLNTKFSLDPTRTIASIRYSCMSNNDCDQEFVRETIGSSKWLDLHELTVRLEIALLLFKGDFSPPDLFCDKNLLCSSNNTCYSQLMGRRSGSQPTTTTFKVGTVCDPSDTPNVHFERQFNTPTDDEATTMDVYCNRNNCNERQTVEQVFKIIQDSFTFPLN